MGTVSSSCFSPLPTRLAYDSCIQYHTHSQDIGQNEAFLYHTNFLHHRSRYSPCSLLKPDELDLHCVHSFCILVLQGTTRMSHYILFISSQGLTWSVINSSRSKSRESHGWAYRSNSLTSWQQFSVLIVSLL